MAYRLTMITDRHACTSKKKKEIEDAREIDEGRGRIPHEYIT